MVRCPFWLKVVATLSLPLRFSSLPPTLHGPAGVPRVVASRGPFLPCGRLPSACTQGPHRLPRATARLRLGLLGRLGAFPP